MDQNDQELQKRFEELPDELAAALVSPDLSAALVRIGHNYNLVQEDIDNLQLLVTLVFFGERHIKNFPQEVADIIDLPNDIIENIASDIGEAVFRPYVEELQEVGDLYAGKAERMAAHNVEGGESIQQHILHEIENPTPSPMVSTPKEESSLPPQAPAPAPELQNLPTARVIPPIAPISVPNYSPARELPKIIKKEEPKPAPTSILMQQLEVPTHSLDHEPNIPEHDEDLMPLIIETSRNAQLAQTQSAPAPAAPTPTPAPSPAPAPTNTPGSEKRYTDPYREPLV